MGFISARIWVVVVVTLLITPLLTTHEPPSRFPSNCITVTPLNYGFPSSCSSVFIRRPRYQKGIKLKGYHRGPKMGIFLN